MSVIGVYDEKVKDEKKLYFKLEEWYDSDVIIKVVNENGKLIINGNLIAINRKTGKIIRKSYFNDTIGFDLDEYGRVKVE